MPPVSFEKTSDSAVRFVKKLGRCIGWGCFSKKAGVEYDDLHGDHFPDDELFAAVGGLMKTDFAAREIDIEHLGAAQGSIVTAWAMTEDVAKSLGVDTAGNYGVLVDFEPSADLLKSIESGEMFALSMFGTAVAEPVAKSGATVDVAAAKRKRVMRDVKLTKWAVCKAPAHEGAGVTLVKSQPSDDVLEAIAKAAPAARRAFVHVPLAKDAAGAKKKLKAAIARHERHMDGTEATDDESQQKMMDEMKEALAELGEDSGMSKGAVAKRTAAATSIEHGHQHLIHDIDEKSGSTSWDSGHGYEHGHYHEWLKADDGTITVLATDGHTHTIATEIAAMSTPADLAKAQADISNLKADFAKRESVLKTALAVACSLPPEQVTYVSRLNESDRDAFLAKSATERAELAKPVYVSKSTGDAFYASDDRRLVEMAKRDDDREVELAKSKAATETATFEKRAQAELPNLKGSLAARAYLIKAADAAPEDIRKECHESLKSADHATASVLRPVGFGAGASPIAGSALEAWEQGLEAFAKAAGKKADHVADEFNETPEGSRLYKAYEDETAAERRVRS
jgi:hypothetical protein